jgi:hypothetical protein
MRQLNEFHVQVMRELRANGWSLEGIARVYREYGVTPETVAFLIKEEGAYPHAR